FTIAAGEGPIEVVGVEDRLGQVLRNLLTNARSFSPKGGTIHVAVARAGGWVEVTVDDEGPGVPEDKREAVFERFFSLRPEGEPFGKHSGLGLSISRQIVEAHGGRIHVENRHGPDGNVRGARFTFALPAA